MMYRRAEWHCRPFVTRTGLAHRIAHVIFVAAIGLGIEILPACGQIERQPAVRGRREPFGDRLSLAAHLIAVQMRDLRTQQPEQHERQENRGDPDRHDVQQDDA